MRNPFRRPAAAPARIEPRIVAAAPAAPLERRDAGGFGMSGAYVGGLGVTTDAVAPHLAENVAAVAACVGAISSGIATLPARVYRVTPAGRVELTRRDHWLPQLIANPSDHCTWPELVETMMSSVLLSGNALALIEYDRDGMPTELRPIPWYCATPIITDSGRLAFNVAMPFPPFLGAGIYRRALASECLYLKDRSDNGGWTGRGRLSRSPAVLAAALGIQTYSAAVYRNFAQPSGAITHPGKLNQDAKTYLRETFEAVHAGPEGAKRLGILDEGMTWTPFAGTPEDAETLESRRFAVPEICRLFSVPPAIVQSLENNAFSSAEQANRWFATGTLAPWCRKFEAAIDKALLGDEPDVRVEIDLSGLTRGDWAARWSAWATAAQNKILTVNEIREMEGFSPMPDAPGELVPGADP